MLSDVEEFSLCSVLFLANYPDLITYLKIV